MTTKPQSILLLILLLLGCTQQSDEHQLEDDMVGFIRAATSAQQQAAAHWDHVIFGNTADCQQGLPILEPFALTQSQADRYPEALAIRDHLNGGIALLRESAMIWDAICADAALLITPADANRGYVAAREAGIEVAVAQSLHASWKP